MLKSALDNPALTSFGQRIPSEGLYDAAESVVLWDAIKGTVGNVTVAYFAPLRIPAEHALWRRWRDYCLQWHFAFGSISPKWMSSDQLRPETVFWYFVATGFASPDDQNRTLKEFGRIRECGWARKLGNHLGLIPEGFLQESTADVDEVTATPIHPEPWL